MSNENDGQAQDDKLTVEKLCMDSRFLNAYTIQEYTTTTKGAVNVLDLFTKLSEKSLKTIESNSTAGIQDMLMTQATTLDAIFNSMMRTGAGYLGKDSKVFERYAKLGLKAQAQCRATLEALAEVKNPKQVTIAKQANIADQQIVNNGTLETRPRVRTEKNNPSNELLGDIHHDTLDSRAKKTTIRADQAVETLGKVNRRKNSSG